MTGLCFVGERDLLANTLRLVGARKNSLPTDERQLRRAALEIYREISKVPLTCGEKIEVSFPGAALTDHPSVVSLMSDEHNLLTPIDAVMDRKFVRRNIDHALLLLRSMSDDYTAMFEFLVSDIVVRVASNSGGGTSSNLLGMIWLSPHQRWTTVDYAEALLHEAIHLNVFLHDVLFELYQNVLKVKEPDALTVSAIRQERRPLDKSFHSACVAVALHEFYSRLGDERTASKFVTPLVRCCEDLRLRAKSHLTDRGRHILKELERYLDAKAGLIAA